MKVYKLVQCDVAGDVYDEQFFDSREKAEVHARSLPGFCEDKIGTWKRVILPDNPIDHTLSRLILWLEIQECEVR